ncbi:acyltransferase [Deinococcus multiflagellatus]|uniref:DapH/DapD/GlmU-related protein n=1 Tax=Deinococcus multiflagellatus TaxID=1656887 RepID=A0ABW1ZLT2_9DEIO|nr:acyltransferase [Deinococcus multiflagellatus]MBZ9714131.1 N-acetyltransferase [Deinococcus multiflagellatus]
MTGPLIHESAYVDEGAQVGDGTRIWHFTHVMPRAVIGEGCSIGQNVLIANDVRVGNGVKIQNNVAVYEGVTLEDYVFCGPSMVFTNVRTPRSEFPRNTGADYLPTLVKRGASIGANATIVCGVTLHEGAFVAAGAVVTRDVPPYVMVAGVPARPIGYMSASGDVLDFEQATEVQDSRGHRYRLVAPWQVERLPSNVEVSPEDAQALPGAEREA